MKSKATGRLDTEDARGEVMDARKLLADVDEALDCAEVCETRDDLKANVDEAIAAATNLLAALRELKKGLR